MPAKHTSSDTVLELERLLQHHSWREQLAILIEHGVPAVAIFALASCLDHIGWHPLAATAPLTFDGTTMWCQKCWKWIQK